MKTIAIGVDIYAYLVSKGMGTSESASTILRRELTRTVEIDDDLHAYILSLATAVGESASSILRRELQLGRPVPQPDATPLVEFHVAAGTGAGPWNTREQTVVATAGQMLRIVNDDTIPHRLHTSGAPFPHPAGDIAPGESVEVLLQAPYDSATQGPLHDHVHGSAAQFWITVRAAG